MYGYLVTGTLSEKMEETLGWRYALPDASYWMYKFATPEEAFLKARETVDLRLKEGTLVRSSQIALNPDTAMLGSCANNRPNQAVPSFSREESFPDKSAVASPTAPPPVYKSIAAPRRSGDWSKRASWGLGLAIVGALVTASDFYKDHPSAPWVWGAMIVLIQTLLSWASLYGGWSALLWLGRCVSFNRSKKPLWNLHAGWSVFLAIMIAGSLTIYCYYNFHSQDEIENAIAGIAASFGSTIFFFYGALTGLAFLRRARSWALRILAGLVLTLIIIAAVVYGGKVLELLPKFLRTPQSAQQTSSSATLQLFDEHLSLKMPIAFEPVTDLPLEQLAPQARERVQKATQRSAFFNGVTVLVIHVIPVQGVEDHREKYYGIQSALDGAFWSYYPAQTPPKIDWGLRNDVYQSGAIRFETNIGGKANQSTVMVIASKSVEGLGLWMITTAADREAAELADNTARAFTFK